MTVQKVVVHDVGVWLSRTKTWLYKMVIGVQPAWRSWVLANRCENTSEFPHEDVFSLRDQYGRLVWFAEMAMVRAGITRRPLLVSREVRRISPAVLHSHFGQVGWANARFALRHGIPHIVSFYGYDVTRLPRAPVWKERYREMFDQVDAVLCEGPHMRDRIVELGCHPERVHVHALGVDVDRLPFLPRSWHPEQTLRVLIAASFREKKGIPIALEAIARVVSENPGIDINVTLVGAAGGSRESLHEQDRIFAVIKECGLESVVTLVGGCSHAALLETAARHHLYLSPSLTASDGDTEGGAPVGLIEMAATGMPVISTSHCDIPNVLGWLNRERLVPEGDLSQLVRSIKWFIENPADWEDMAVANRKFIDEGQNSNLQVQRLAAFYDRLSGLSGEQ